MNNNDNELRSDELLFESINRTAVDCNLAGMDAVCVSQQSHKLFKSFDCEDFGGSHDTCVSFDCIWSSIFTDNVDDDNDDLIKRSVQWPKQTLDVDGADIGVP